MICHERVAKREQHDESQDRTKGGNEKCNRDFNASPEVSPNEVDDHARRNAQGQPDVVNWIRRRNVPSRINKGQIGRPKDFAEIKPNSPARYEDSLDWAEKGKRRAVRSLMVTLPPNCE